MAAAVLAVGSAQAQEGRRWSILGPDTVPVGADVISGAFGWPDVSFGYTHGISPTFDAGARFSLLYGVENTTTTQFGLALAAPLRFHLLSRDKVGILFHIDPGLRLYTTSPASFGFQFPVGVNFGIHVTPELTIGAGADFWASLFVSGIASPGFLFGPLIGPYIEYHIDPQLVIGLDTRFGAIIAAGSNIQTTTNFGFRTQVVFGYRL